MSTRTLVDATGRSWSCTAAPTAADASSHGKDVVLSCATASVTQPVDVRVGWQWETMSDNGLARIINLASPVPRN